MRDLNEVHSRVEEWVSGSNFDGLIGDVIGSVDHYVFATIHDALKNLAILRVGDLDFEAFVSRFDSHPNYRVLRS